MNAERTDLTPARAESEDEVHIVIVEAELASAGKATATPTQRVNRRTDTRSRATLSSPL